MCKLADKTHCQLREGILTSTQREEDIPLSRVRLKLPEVERPSQNRERGVADQIGGDHDQLIVLTQAQVQPVQLQKGPDQQQASLTRSDLHATDLHAAADDGGEDDEIR